MWWIVGKACFLGYFVFLVGNKQSANKAFSGFTVFRRHLNSFGFKEVLPSAHNVNIAALCFRQDTEIRAYSAFNRESFFETTRKEIVKALVALHLTLSL